MDIVEWLRRNAQYLWNSKRVIEAADTIENLRAVLAQIIVHYPFPPSVEVQKINEGIQYALTKLKTPEGNN